MSNEKRLEAIERTIQMWLCDKIDNYTAMVMVSILSEPIEENETS